MLIAIEDSLPLSFLFHLSVIFLAVLCMVIVRQLMFRIGGATIGTRATVFSTGVIGTVVHEVSHAIVLFVLGCKINAISFFEYQPKAGVLGYVNYSYRYTALDGKLMCYVAAFFGNIAPLFGGIGAFGLFNYLVFGDIWPLSSLEAIPTFSDLFTWLRVALTDLPISTLLYMYLLISVVLHCVPSKRDFINAAPGLVVVVILLGLFCALQDAMPTDNIVINGLMVTSHLLVLLLQLQVIGVAAFAALCGLYQLNDKILYKSRVRRSS